MGLEMVELMVVVKVAQLLGLVPQHVLIELVVEQLFLAGEQRCELLEVDVVWQQTFLKEKHFLKVDNFEHVVKAVVLRKHLLVYLVVAVMISVIGQPTLIDFVVSADFCSKSASKYEIAEDFLLRQVRTKLNKHGFIS